ncbi:MAG: Uncharacterized conserved protein, DUF497 family [Candidatus Kentron sp. G]|nr:MAG: Uncharacterized conserved protein, DUF497 family [Candidatus Kentron sp. G]VFN02161.1 MAG: Uncharacterized conserved protein, DUF497 family [Candidatus Kentron sp. G]VFN04072.1 MAG: Uncharacterized conserved protein, DUF497 family [Candidatus Kentron sp. G]
MLSGFNMYKYTYHDNGATGIEWDNTKCLDNLAKHGVDFLDCESVFSDPLALTREDHRHGEERFVIMGMDDVGRLLVVAYTWRRDAFRIRLYRKCSDRPFRSIGCGPPRWISDNDYYLRPQG